MLFSNTLLPNVRDVLATYCKYSGIELREIPSESGRTSLKEMKAMLASGDIAGAIVPSVNRFGIIEDLDGFADEIHAAKALMVIYCDPSALAVLKTPAGWGADIAVGDCQSLGMPLCYGGPYAGFMACRSEYMRRLPGRIVGQTADRQGRRCFVLTLQAREQHIRREKATSNICSNESLMALWATIYLSLMGPAGMRRVNELSSALAHSLCERLLETGLFEKPFDAPFLKEFALKPLCDPAALQEALADEGIFGALLSEEGYVSFAVTEKRTPDEIDRLVKAVRRVKP